MTPFVVERLVQLRRHVDHLRTLRGAVHSREDLDRLDPIDEFIDLVRAIESDS